MDSKYIELCGLVRSLYPAEGQILLHGPKFSGNEKAYLAECIDTEYVSYIGAFVSRFEDSVRSLTGSKYAIAMVNGTAAIQMALIAAGLKPGDEVITQALTFVATPNAIRHAGGEPVFIDVDRDTLGMSPDALRKFLSANMQKRPDGVYNRVTGRRVFAVMPMHTFGFVLRIEEIAEICRDWDLPLVEDAAESIGSSSGSHHAGRFGLASTLSFNGNKVITTGGGGMLLTDDDTIANRARHISTTSKRKHPWEFFHDELGWNLRMPNVNAAIGCAQMEQFDSILENKRATAAQYIHWGAEHGIRFVQERPGTKANYWLNAMVVEDRTVRDEFLAYSNGQGIQTRPIWVLMNKLPMYEGSFSGPLPESTWLEERIVNIPSSIRR